MKTKFFFTFLLLLTFYLNKSQASNEDSLFTLNERLAFVKLASVPETETMIDLDQNFFQTESSYYSHFLSFFSDLIKLELMDCTSRNDTLAFQHYRNMRNYFAEGKTPPIEEANAFFAAFNDFEAREERGEPQYRLKDFERGYFYTYIGIIKLLFKETEVATNYLLEARQLLLEKTPFANNSYWVKTNEEFFFEKVIQPYFQELSRQSLEPSIDEKKLWVHFSHLYDREYSRLRIFHETLDYARSILPSLQSASHFADIELLTKIQNIISITKLFGRSFTNDVNEQEITDSTPSPRTITSDQDADTYTKIVQQVISFHPFPKLFLYRHPMTLCKGILFLERVILALSKQIMQTHPTFSVQLYTTKIQQYRVYQNQWASGILSFYLAEIINLTALDDEYLFLSNISKHEIEILLPILFQVAENFHISNFIDSSSIRPKIAFIQQTERPIDFILKILDTILEKRTISRG